MSTLSASIMHPSIPNNQIMCYAKVILISVGLSSMRPRLKRSNKSIISSLVQIASDCGFRILLQIFSSSLSSRVWNSKKHLMLQQVSKSILAFSFDQSSPKPAIILRCKSSQRSLETYANFSRMLNEIWLFEFYSTILSCSFFIFSLIVALFAFCWKRSLLIRSISRLISCSSILIRDLNSESS